MTIPITRRTPYMVGILALLVAAGLAMRTFPASAESAKVIPPPAVDAAAAQAPSAVAVFAGGCFWGVQGVFQHVKGVTNAVSGYAGGLGKTADYETVSSGGTGHAESVQVTFDPRQVSYGTLLRIYFSVAHDPTELNRQGPDRGTQYRSTIFPVDAEQASVAKAYIDQINQTHVFKKALATTIETDRTFYPAEAYHQNYLTNHPTDSYVAYNDMPKIDDLKRAFPDLYIAKPALVDIRGFSNRR